MARYILCHRCPHWLTKYDIIESDHCRIVLGTAKLPRPDELIVINDLSIGVKTVRTGAQTGAFGCTVCGSVIVQGAPCLAVSLWRPDAWPEAVPEPEWETDALSPLDDDAWLALTNRLITADRRVNQFNK